MRFPFLQTNEACYVRQQTFHSRQFFSGVKITTVPSHCIEYGSAYVAGFYKHGNEFSGLKKGG
jgi:hypothetical protein